MSRACHGIGAGPRIQQDTQHSVLDVVCCRPPGELDLTNRGAAVISFDLTRYNWLCDGAVTTDGIGRRLLSFFTKHGCYFGIMTGLLCSGQSVALTWSLAALCSPCCACDSALNWTPWTRALRGAYKSCRGNAFLGAPGLRQATGCCLLPLLMLAVLCGGTVAVTGLLVLQVRKRQYGMRQPTALMCSQSLLYAVCVFALLGA